MWLLCVVCFPDLLSLCIDRECLLVLEFRILGWFGERKVGGCVCDPLEHEVSKEEHSGIPAPELGMRLGDWFLGAVSRCGLPSACLLL